MRGEARVVGLLLGGPGEGCPALRGDPAGDEHLHESHWPHSTCSRWTLTGPRGPEAGCNVGGGASERAREEGGAGCGRGTGGGGGASECWFRH